MSHDHDDAPLALDHPDEVLRLREALDRAGYEPRRLAVLLNVGPMELLSFRPSPAELTVYRRHTASGGPLDTLVRLFLLGDEVDLETARRDLAPSGVGSWLAGGLLEERGGERACFLLVPFDKLVLAIDPWWAEEVRPNYVLGIGPPTLDLAQMTIRRPSRATLDVGRGAAFRACWRPRTASRWSASTATSARSTSPTSTPSSTGCPTPPFSPATFFRRSWIAGSI